MNSAEDYLAPSCGPGNLDRFLIRDRIRKSLEAILPHFSGVFLDVGCGFKPYHSLILSDACSVNQYIGLDFPDSLYGVPDLAWDGRHIPLADCTVDAAMATEVLEHCPDPDAVLAEIFRVLKPGGVFFFTTPFLWPLHEMPHDYFRYTPRGLEALLSRSGFGEVEITPLGGWDASLAQLLGLWVSRRPMPVSLRKLLCLLVWPAYRMLLYIDKLPQGFRSDTVFPGLSGLARKPVGRNG